MLAGKMGIATGVGAAPFVTAQLEGSSPFLLVGSWVNVFPYKIMAHKSIKKIEELKGKTGNVGAPFGTIPDTALRFALSRFNIDPERDVKLVQHSNADPASILQAMNKGEVDFGILAPPLDLAAERRGYEMLLALPTLGIPWQQNGEIVLGSYLKSNRDAVIRFMRATAEASNYYFEQKTKTIEIMTGYLGRPRNETEYAYDEYEKWADKNHRPLSATSFGVGWLWHDPARRSTVAAENLFGYDLLSLALNRRSEGNSMIYLPNYAGALRCIGQSLESRNIDVFELIVTDDEFVVQCPDPDPPYTKLLKLHYSLDIITILDREGQVKRRRVKSEFRFDSLPEILRAAGKYLDSKRAQLRQLNNCVSEGEIELEYQIRSRGMQSERLNLSLIRKIAVNMYKQRSRISNPIEILAHRL